MDPGARHRDPVIADANTGLGLSKPIVDETETPAVWQHPRPMLKCNTIFPLRSRSASGRSDKIGDLVRALCQLLVACFARWQLVRLGGQFVLDFL